MGTLQPLPVHQKARRQGERRWKKKRPVGLICPWYETNWNGE